MNETTKKLLNQFCIDIARGDAAMIDEMDDDQAIKAISDPDNALPEDVKPTAAQWRELIATLRSVRPICGILSNHCRGSAVGAVIHCRPIKVSEAGYTSWLFVYAETKGKMTDVTPAICKATKYEYNETTGFMRTAQGVGIQDIREVLKSSLGFSVFIDLL